MFKHYVILLEYICSSVIGLQTEVSRENSGQQRQRTEIELPVEPQWIPQEPHVFPQFRQNNQLSYPLIYSYLASTEEQVSAWWDLRSSLWMLRRLLPSMLWCHIGCYKCKNVSAKRDASSSGSKNVPVSLSLSLSIYIYIYIYTHTYIYIGEILCIAKWRDIISQ
jgi:hypothetical protein